MASGRACVLLAVGLLCAGCRGERRAGPIRGEPGIEAPVAPAEEIAVVATVPGHGAAEVEQSLTRVLEETVAGVAAVDGLRSTSSEGRAVVRATLRRGAEPYQVIAQVSNALAGVLPRLPQDTEPPIVMRVEVQPVEVRYLVRADRLSRVELGALHERLVGVALERVGGVAGVSACGVAEREVAVDVDPARLAALGLGIEAVLAALRSASLELPAGRIVDSGREVTVVSTGGAGIDTLGDTVIGTAGASPVRLRDVAAISDGVASGGCVAVGTGAGAPVAGTVRLQRGAERAPVERRLRELVAELPAGVTLSLLGDGRPPRRLAVSLPAGTPPEQRHAVAVRLVRELGALPGTGDVVIEAGAPSSDPGASTADLLVLVTGDADAALAALEPEPGLIVRVPGPPGDVRARVQGPELEVLASVAGDLVAILRGATGVAAAGVDGVELAPTKDVQLDRERLAAFGVTPAAAAEAVRVALAGVDAGAVRLGDREVPVRVRARVAGAAADPLQVPLLLPDGRQVPLAQVATITVSQSPGSILRVGRERAVEVWARPAAGAKLDLADARRRAARELRLPLGVRVVWLD